MKYDENTLNKVLSDLEKINRKPGVVSASIDVLRPPLDGEESSRKLMETTEWSARSSRYRYGFWIARSLKHILNEVMDIPSAYLSINLVDRHNYIHPYQVSMERLRSSGGGIKDA